MAIQWHLQCTSLGRMNLQIALKKEDGRSTSYSKLAYEDDILDFLV